MIIKGFKKIKNTFKSLGLAGYTFSKNEGFEHAGYLSFLLMLSIFPFLVLMVSIVSLIGEHKLSVLFLEIILSPEIEVFFKSIKARLIEIIKSPPEGLLTFVALSAIWTASSMLEAIKTCLNKAYCVKTPPNYLLRRLFSIVEFLILLIFILTILSILLFAPTILDYLFKLLHIDIENSSIITLVNENSKQIRSGFLMIFGFITVIGLYHFIPNHKGWRLRHAAPGAVLVLIAWSGFSMLFKFYLGYFTQLNIIYGGIAGIIITLIFFYVCSIIFVYGAEFNFHLHKKSK